MIYSARRDMLPKQALLGLSCQMSNILPRAALAVACLVFSLASPASAQDMPVLAPNVPAASGTTPNCPLQVYARLDMIDLENGLPVIPVKIENRDLYFLIDTGGLVNTLSSNLVRELNLETQPTTRPVYGLGMTMNSYVTLKNFSLGPIQGEDMQFLVQQIEIPGVAGALSPETMRKFDVDFDFTGGKFGIYSSDHCPGGVSYWTKDAAIAVPMTVDRSGHVRFIIHQDGKAMTATLDTGSVTSVMTIRAASKILGIDESTEGVQETTYTINRTRRAIYVYPFQSLSIDSLVIDKPSIIILKDDDTDLLGTDLVLGVDALRHFHIYIAYQEGKLYLTPAEAH
jgi:predicted aspartyl protease